MDAVRNYITEGLAQRAKAQLKVRQPIASITTPEFDEQYKEIALEELNAKEVKWGKAVEIDTKITPELKQEGLMREVIRAVQNARKQADLQVDDRIKLRLATDDKQLAKAINEHGDTITTETLTTKLTDQKLAHSSTTKIDDSHLEISLEKA